MCVCLPSSLVSKLECTCSPAAVCLCRFCNVSVCVSVCVCVEGRESSSGSGQVKCWGDVTVSTVLLLGFITFTLQAQGYQLPKSYYTVHRPAHTYAHTHNKTLHLQIHSAVKHHTYAHSPPKSPLLVILPESLWGIFSFASHVFSGSVMKAVGHCRCLWF